MPGIGGSPMAQLGTARGNIEIGTADLTKLVATTRQVGQQVKTNLGQIDAGARSAELRLAALSKNIGKLRGELTALSLGAGLLTGLGLKTAGSIEETGIQLKGMLGSQAAANKLMAQLKTEAQAAGVPFGDMLQASRQLLPSLQGNTKELNTWLGLVRRVATLNPREGITGAAFGINEAMVSGGSDLVSLAERFNISRKSIQLELEKNGGDLAAALDVVLNKMGVTQATAEEMGQTFNASFRAAKDAALQAAGAGFTPLMQTLTPILRATADWFTQLQQGNPEVLKWGAGIATVATVGAPTLLLLNNLIEAGLRLKQLGILGGIGRVAGAGLVIGATAAVGVAAANKVGAVTGSEAFSRVSMESLWANFRAMIFSISYALNRGVVQMVNGLAAATSALLHFAGDLILTGSALLRDMANKLPGGLGDGMRANADIFDGAGLRLRTDGARATMAAAANDEASKKFLESLANNFFGFKVKWGDQGWDPVAASRAHQADQAGAGDDGSAAQRALLEQQTNDKIIDAKLAWATGVQQIESQANAARLAATQQYENQRTQTIAQYEKSIARDAQDFAISRARAAQQLADQLADVASEAARREADWTADLNEQIAKAQTEGNDRLAEIEADYQKSRARAAQQHTDTLYEAAGRLDAKAILAEQRRYDRESKNAAEDHDDRIKKEKESLQESIEQNQAAHAERLAEAREADQRRIDDMRAGLAESQRLEDEDRALRLARQAEDHADSLAAMATAHAAQLAAIEAQAAAERELLDQQTATELAKLDQKNKAWLTIQDEQQKASLRLFDKFWEAWNKRFELYGPGRDPNAKFFSGFTNENPYGPAPDPNATPTPDWFTTFGKSATTDPAVIRSAMAGGLVAPGSAGGGGGVRGFGGANLTLGEGAIVIYGAPGQSEEKIGAVVEQRLMGLFRELAPQ